MHAAVAEYTLSGPGNSHRIPNGVLAQLVYLVEFAESCSG